MFSTIQTRIWNGVLNPTDAQFSTEYYNNHDSDSKIFHIEKNISDYDRVGRIDNSHTLQCERLSSWLSTSFLSYNSVTFFVFNCN